MFNFEINIAIKNPLINEVWATILSLFGESITEIKVVNDWDYENSKSYSVNEVCKLGEFSQSDIVIVYAKDYDTRNCGCIIREKNNSIICSFWKSCDDNSDVDTALITDRNKMLYTHTAEFMIRKFNNFEILYIAIGCEMFIYESEDFKRSIVKSTALAWVVNSSKIDVAPNGFISEDIGEYKMLLKNELA